MKNVRKALEVAAMAHVGVRELKNSLSRYLSRVKAGEQIVVTARGKATALLIPTEQPKERRALETLVREGVARWAGGKPRGSKRPPKVRGRSIAETVVKDRR